MTDEILTFVDRQAFRDWLAKNGEESGGVWLLFGKKGGPKTLTAVQALEEALCFGWIDGQMQSLGDTAYKKYFARRIPKSVWSSKNKKTAEALAEKGLMTPQGLFAIEEAKRNGAWEAEAGSRAPLEEDAVERFKQLVLPYEPAYTNLMAMSPSVQRTYTGFYFSAKSDATREARLAKIVDRLNQNLKPM